MRRLIAFALVLAVIAPFAHADRIKMPQFTLSASFMGLGVADTALTIYGTKNLGLIEVNRLMRPLLENHRYAALWTIQVVGSAAILGACHFLIHGDEKVTRIIGWTLLIAANIARGYIVIHNARLNARVGK